ncbi:MAG: FtsW/RodA/SpoVE family cell cycle protein [Lachnospiraceae bacterium]|nr:FtsW/RodA/SpoVE family cell cycle protein [Lachnospiraceae bacterium]
MAKERQARRAKKADNFFDYTLLFTVLFLVVFGLVVLYSVSSYDGTLKHGDNAYFLKKQLLATGLGMVALVMAIVVDYHFICKFAPAIYGISVLLIFLIWTPLGRTINGARRWLYFGGISVQPAEIVKVAVIVFLSVLIAGIGTSIKDIRSFFVILAFAAVPAALLLWITRNLSSALIVGGIAAVILFMADPDYLKYFGLAALAVIVALFFVLFSLHKAESAEGTGDFRQNRIVAWLHPEDFEEETSFQTIQALYAIGSGGTFGKGLGESIQKYKIPEAQNDMVFAIICEELGAFGGVCVLGLFGLLIYRCMLIAINAPDTLGSLLVAGVMGHFALQVILNIAVVTNTIPNTGVTLPFISYGGTSVIFLLIEIGLVLNVSLRIRKQEQIA